MPVRSFITQLSILTLITLVLLLGVHYFIPSLQKHQALSWSSLAVFVLITILMYWVGKQTATSKNRNMFSAVVLGSVFGKMAFSLLIVVIYTREVEPDSKYFILPFFVVYLIFTIFETYFLTRLGKQKPQD
ncbi:MAG: hypothetical protein GYB31_19400 [Bacteroidetes bacterium]|nr:hypothetical protein [Bacteroidota bacterium]